MQTEVLVLGGGPGGYAAAFLAANLGMDVTIVEADPRLGGTCLLRGCIPSKALLHVTDVMSEADHLDEWGVSFDTPKIDVDKLRARKNKVIDTLSGGLTQLAKQRKVRVVQARGVFVDSTTLRLENVGTDLPAEQITFEHCILATGSVPARPGIFNVDDDRVIDSTGALELRDVPKSFLVIGGGYIGLEMGTVYARLGAKVSVVELLPGLLPGADRDLVKPLHNRIKDMFEEILLETKVTRLEPTKKGITVHFEGDGAPDSRTYDRVLVSVGRWPNSKGFGLENTKVEIDERGFVKVDKRQRTADPHILAIGDVAGEPGLAHKATREGRVAAEVLHGDETALFDNRAIPAVVFTDPEIAWAGLTETQAKDQGRNVKVAKYPWAASGRAQALARTEGLTKMILDPETDRVLGVGIVGKGAGELISETVLAIEMGCHVKDITESIHPHPTMSETIPNAGEVYLGLATELYRPRRG